MMTSVDEVPDVLMTQIRSRFEGEPTVQRLRVRQQVLQREGKFKEAMEQAKEIEALFQGVVYEYLKIAEEQAESVNFGRVGMSPDEKEHCYALVMGMFMACDLIERAVMDVDDVIKRHDKDLVFEEFNDLRQLASLAKAKLKFFQREGDYMQDLIWADKCDDMYEVLMSKAASIYRKHKQGKDWGENVRRLRERK